MTAYLDKAPFQSWGRVVKRDYPTARPRFLADLPGIVADPARPATSLPVGMGRSYGDSCLNGGGGLIEMRGLDRIIEIDPEALTLRAQAGLTLSQALRLLVPRGLFIPVLPGTRFATLGGAVANDIHGKNHQVAGSFGAHVNRLELIRSDAAPQTLVPGQANGLFEATIGGLGLTGVISWVDIDLIDIDSAWLEVEDIAFRSLDEYFTLMESSSGWEHRVAWIDCTRPGRGIFSRARFLDDGRLRAHQDATRINAPPISPAFLLNGATLRLFNAAYAAAKQANGQRKTIHYAPFFFPLDSIGGWNRMYGENGFYQYQCVVPPAEAKDTVAALLATIAKAGDGSLLAVLKNFGPQRSAGLISFPMEGTTLALDFRNRGERTLRLFGKLDAIVREVGGRLYPAKDGRIPAEVFQAMYPRWRELEALRDPAIQSDFWTRVCAA
jgi:FAD/FMN-containing dehydrogenase